MLDRYFGDHRERILSAEKKDISRLFGVFTRDLTSELLDVYLNHGERKLTEHLLMKPLNFFDLPDLYTLSLREEIKSFKTVGKENLDLDSIIENIPDFDGKLDIDDYIAKLGNIYRPVRVIVKSIGPISDVRIVYMHNGLKVYELVIS